MTSFEGQLKIVVSFLEEFGVEYVLIGGLAVAIHGEPRFTADIDICIKLARNRISSFIKAAAAHGLHPAEPSVEDFAKKTGVLPFIAEWGPLCMIDFIIAQNPIELSAIRRSQAVESRGLSVRCITAEDLLIHKLASSRAKDHEDAAAIIERQAGAMDYAYIEKWLARIEQEAGDKKPLQRYKKLRP